MTYTVKVAKAIANSAAAYQALEHEYVAAFNSPEMFAEQIWDKVHNKYVKVATSPLDNPVPSGQVGNGNRMTIFRRNFIAKRRLLLALHWFRMGERPDGMNQITRVGDIVVQGAEIGIQFGEVIAINPNGTMKLRVFAETCPGTYFLMAPRDGSHTVTQQRQANTFVKVPFTEDQILQGTRAYHALEP
jgi:hypothetical protein